jgi:hypothetical protein
MNYTGDAAEQIVRMSLDGVEVAAKITGAAAKEIALLLFAALKDRDNNLKLKGKANLISMLKSGKPVEIFSVKESDVEEFTKRADQYGIVYCALVGKKRDDDGVCDFLVKSSDAPTISRIIDRYEFATVDRAKIANETAGPETEQAQVQTDAEKDAVERPGMDRGSAEAVVADLLGSNEGKTEPEKQPEAERPSAPTPTPAKEVVQNPGPAMAAESRPSEPISERGRNSAGATSTKPSVLEELNEIRAERKEREVDARQRNERKSPGRGKSNTGTVHRRPPTRSGRTKSKKTRKGHNHVRLR